MNDKIVGFPEKTGPAGQLQDQFKRPLRDLRISVMDRCNFRCPYCMPEDKYHKDFQFMNSDERLSFAEIVRVAKIFAQAGAYKLRITGGEPLLRSDLPVLISMLADLGELDLALTTNGSLLPRFAQPLAEAGLGRVTVSLDSLNDDVFRRMNDAEVSVNQVLEGAGFYFVHCRQQGQIYTGLAILIYDNKAFLIRILIKFDQKPEVGL